MLKRLKEMRDNKKGFTLVELIVVLVILAILAALLIPALTGYIDKAREKQITAETRQVVMAAQTLADEEYAKDGDGAITLDMAATTVPDPRAPHTVYRCEVAALAEIKEVGNINGITFNDGKVAEVVYVSGGKTCTYTEANGQYVIKETPKP